MNDGDYQEATTAFIVGDQAKRHVSTLLTYLAIKELESLRHYASDVEGPLRSRRREVDVD